jgi:hypothetical protein
MTIESKEKIKAILRSEIMKFIESLGLVNEYLDGKLSCSICHSTLNENNFGSASKRGGKIHLSCDKEFCLSEILSNSTRNTK